MMSKLKVSLLSGAAAAATMALGASSAFATNGMMPHCVGTYKCGMGGAGVAYATDATNAAINPALGARLGNEVIINAGWFRANVSGEIKGTNGQANIGNGAQKSSAKDFANGSVGINMAIDDSMTFNLSIFPGGGGASNWQYGRTNGANMGSNGGDSKIRYRMFYIQPSIAIKMSDTSSYGVGIILSKSDVKGDALGAYNVANPNPNKKETANGIGFQVGGAWDIASDASLGLNFRSPVWHQSFNNNHYRTFKDAVNSPMQLTGGIAVDDAGVEGLKVAVDGKWINWAGVDTIGGMEPEAGAFGWQDQFVLMAGLEYDLGDAMAVRAGYNYGNSPIDEEHVFANFLFPAVVEHHFTAGASMGVSDSVELGLSGFWAPANRVENDDTGSAGTYSGMGNGTWLKMSQYGAQVSVKVGF